MPATTKGGWNWHADSSCVPPPAQVIIHPTWIAGPVGMSLGLLLMQLTSTTHPPGARLTGACAGWSCAGCLRRCPPALGSCLHRPCACVRLPACPPACVCHCTAQQAAPRRTDDPHRVGRRRRRRHRPHCCHHDHPAQVARLFFHRHHPCRQLGDAGATCSAHQSKLHVHRLGALLLQLHCGRAADGNNCGVGPHAPCRCSLGCLQGRHGPGR